MRLISMLLGNEWLKTRKRPVFFVPLGLFVGIDLIGFGYNLRESLRAGDRSFSLPGQWTQIFGESSNVPLVFAGVVVILLVANEFTWRTARQNVIDGLSRGEWYWGKAMIAAFIVLLFAAVHVGLGGGLALTNTPDVTAGVFTRVHAAALGGLFLSGIGYASFALLSATLVRSAGAAMAVWFFYLMIAEGLVRFAIGRLWEGARSVVEFAPIHTFNELRNFFVFDPSGLEAENARRAAAELPAATAGDPAALTLAAVAWILVFALSGWYLCRRRDL